MVYIAKRLLSEASISLLYADGESEVVSSSLGKSLLKSIRIAVFLLISDEKSDEFSRNDGIPRNKNPKNITRAYTYYSLSFGIIHCSTTLNNLLFKFIVL